MKDNQNNLSCWRSPWRVQPFGLRCHPFGLSLSKAGLVIWLVGSSSLASAQSLTEVYRKAQIEDSQYRAARKSYEATLEKLPQARAGLVPTVNLTGNKSHQTGDSSFSGAAPVNRDVKSWTWTAQVTQPLIRWASWVNVTQATSQIEQARAQLALAEQDLMLRTAQTYLDIMLAAENIRVAEAQLNAVNEQLVLAERNFAVGTGIITDIYEAKTKRGSAQSQRMAALNELASKQADLEKILGDELVLTPMRMSKNLPMLDKTQLKEWIYRATLDNLQVKIQKAALDVSASETTKSQSVHAPTLDLTYNRAGAFNSGSLSSPADLTTRTQSHQAGLQLTVPLYAGGATESRVRESLLLEGKAYEELVGAKRSARMQARQAFAGVMNGQAQIEALQAAVESGVQAVEANKIGFRIGTRINPDVLNAEQQLYSAMRDLMKARVDAVMQGLKLKAATGALQEQDLTALDRLAEAADRQVVAAPVPPVPVLVPAPAAVVQINAAPSVPSVSTSLVVPTPLTPTPSAVPPPQIPVSASKARHNWLIKLHGRIVRAAPDTKSELLMRLGAGSVVAQGTEPAYPPRFEYWRHVVVGGVKGWMASDALESTPLPPKTVTYP